ACVLGRIFSTWRPDPARSRPRLQTAARKPLASICRQGWSNWRGGSIQGSISVKPKSNISHLQIVPLTRTSVASASDIFHGPKPQARSVCAAIKPGGRIALSWWDGPARQRIQGLFRETIAELAVTLPPDLPQAHNSYRFSDTEEFLRLLS